jgi:type I restriction enzyme M protein
MTVPNVLEFQKVCPIEFRTNIDPEFEIVPEAYLDAKPPTTDELQDGMQKIIREHLAFLIRTNLFSKEISDNISTEVIQHNVAFQEIPVVNLFNTAKGHYHVSSELDTGSVPLISCSTENMGIEGYFDIKEELHTNCLTVASDGTPLTTFFQPYPFAAKDNVIILKPKENLKSSTKLFVALQLNRMRWRFSYGRKCYSQKFKKIKIFLPFKDGKIDENYIEQLCQHCYGWNELKAFMEK